MFAYLLVAVLGPGEVGQTVVATVGGEPVYARQLERMLEEATAGQEISPAAVPFVKAQVLSEIVDRRLVLAYARRTRSGASEAEIEAAFEQFKSRLAAQRRSIADYLRDESLTEGDLRRRIAWRLCWRKYLDRYITDERVESHFQEHRRRFDGTELAVSHILLRAADGEPDTEAVMDSAGQLRRMILSGEVTFADAARQHSTAPSAQDGGRLGWIKRHGAMDEAFSRAAFALDNGQVSGPVRTRFGVHLIRCDDVRPGTRPLADVRDEVVESLARELLEKLARLEARYTPVKSTGKLPYFKPRGSGQGSGARGQGPGLD